MSRRLGESSLDVLQDISIVGNSPEARRVRRATKKLAKIEGNILIVGETGVGKDLFAQHVHLRSNRKNKNLVKINCASFGKTIEAKHLYGEEGEYEDSVTRTIGLLEKAHKGILYLDNLDAMNKDYQDEFLRILEDGTFRRVGGSENIEIDIRVISSVEDDMTPEVEKNEFRRDLYHLLNTLTVKIPALRERKQDIPELFSYFLAKYCDENKSEEPAVQSEIFESILEYDWKGNIRELENTVQNLIIMSPEGELSPDYLPFRIKRHPLDFLEPRNLKGIVSDVEIYLIKKALGKFGGNQVKAARLLGIPEATLRFKMKKYSIPKD
ncbi:sigma-54-dependent Fis family transcriptional regulator [candidate division KSB1 bacterium]|nr:sigma-54-dependent Fis family transcriptional regulator [candidate division KSB1 bacterium]